MEIDPAQLAEEFRTRYRSTPRIFQAPGRINLIGEHTDYNDGFVMPFAIDRRTLVAGSARDDRTIRVYSNERNEEATIDLDGTPVMRRGTWVDYVEGSARSIARRFDVKLRGADLLVSSNVPMGAGLSSSAALEISVGLALLALNDLNVDEKELAFAAQEAEHEFVGTRSGIMDQFSSVFGKAGKAMLLDCRSLDIEQIPLKRDEAVIAAIDTKVKHNLASSEYNTRREECEASVALLQQHLPDIRSLRDVTVDDFKRYASDLPETLYRRCRHIVTENARTLAAASAFRECDFNSAGDLMAGSHRSLRDDYEVSCPELDFLVDTALGVGGVYGARMTGGGFGGCTVNLVSRNSIEELRAATAEKYRTRFGFAPDFYLFKPADGASEVTV